MILHKVPLFFLIDYPIFLYVQLFHSLGLPLFICNHFLYVPFLATTFCCKDLAGPTRFHNYFASQSLFWPLALRF